MNTQEMEGAPSGLGGLAEAVAAGCATTGAPVGDLLLDIELPVSVSFGRAKLPLKDVLRLSLNSLIELDRRLDDPVEVLVDDRVIARGEVVSVDGNYGVRILEVVKPKEWIARGGAA
ncbi:MAG: flagellar motor switch protein FliN [Acidobacteria bacterium]|nr:flagellar motor switch protein FliN [Acidobacteriota bacterium]